MTSGIYKIVCSKSDRCYVGSAVDVARRWSRHVWALKDGSHHSPKLQNAWNKYGADTFSVVLLEVVSTADTLVSREQFWLDALDARAKGYNCRLAASSQFGLKMTAESREKIRVARKAQKIAPETIAAMVRANKTTRVYSPLSEETRAKLRAKMKGRKLSDKTRAAMAASRRGVLRSDEAKKNMSLAQAASWQRRKLNISQETVRM